MPSILLVEDDIDVRLVFIEILHDAGYEVDAAPSLAAGESILDGRAYDAVIADARLPDGSGTILADKAATRGIPALVVTGNAFDGIDHGRYTVLAKPMSPNALLAAVADLLGD